MTGEIDWNTSFNKRFYSLQNQIYRKYPNLVRTQVKIISEII